MKKILSMILTLALMAVMLSGCGDKAPDSQGSSPSGGSGGAAVDSTGNDSQGTPDDGGSQAEPVTVKVSYPCLVIVPSPDATKGVEDAINAHLAEVGSGVRLELEALDGMTYANTIEMKQIGNEQVDLYMCLTDLAAQVSKNKVAPITQYVDTALKPILDITGTTLIDATTFNGEVYGVPCYRGDVVVYYLIVEADKAEQDLGLTLDNMKEYYTIDEVTEMVATLHEKYPDKIAMGVRPGANGAANNFCLSAIYAGPDYFSVSDMGSGVGIVGEDTTVKNLYETEYFRTVCQKAYEWNQAGYANKDASVATEEGYDLMKADRALSYIIGYGWYNPQITDAATDTTHGKSVLYIPIAPTLNKPSGLDWCVSYSCQNVEAACEALSLFYTDPFVMNSILYGLEGRDWEDTGLGSSPEDKVIKLPEGKSMFDVPYYAYFTCGMMGNEYIDWVQVNPDGTFEDRRAANQEYTRNAKASPIYGFVLNTESVKTAAASVSTVEQKYLGGLLTGELNPETEIPKFIDELKSAGIDDIVAEAQSQLDAWIAAKK